MSLWIWGVVRLADKCRWLSTGWSRSGERISLVSPAANMKEERTDNCDHLHSDDLWALYAAWSLPTDPGTGFMLASIRAAMVDLLHAATASGMDEC